MKGRGIGRAILLGAVLGVMVVSAAVIAFVLLSSRAERASMDKALLVVTGPGKEQAAVVYVVDEIDFRTSPPTVRSIDPLRQVTVPGTSYRRLREAYPFGGSVGVAKALASVEGTRALPVLELTAGAWESVAGSGIDIDVPNRIYIFNGDRLATFDPGSRHLAAGDVYDLGMGSEYLSSADRLALQRALGTAAVRAVAENRDMLLSLRASGQIKSDLSKEGLARFVRRIGAARESKAE